MSVLKHGGLVQKVCQSVGIFSWLPLNYEDFYLYVFYIWMIFYLDCILFGWLIVFQMATRCKNYNLKPFLEAVSPAAAFAYIKPRLPSGLRAVLYSSLKAINPPPTMFTIFSQCIQISCIFRCLLASL